MSSNLLIVLLLAFVVLSNIFSVKQPHRPTWVDYFYFIVFLAMAVYSFSTVKTLFLIFGYTIAAFSEFYYHNLFVNFNKKQK